VAFWWLIGGAGGAVTFERCLASLGRMVSAGVQVELGWDEVRAVRLNRRALRCGVGAKSRMNAQYAAERLLLELPAVRIYRKQQSEVIFSTEVASRLSIEAQTWGVLIKLQRSVVYRVEEISEA